MFLQSLIDRNREFIHCVKTLHRAGELEPNTFVIDLDTVRTNAAIIHEAARQFGLSVYGMTKQIGYNPLVHEAVSQAGITQFVAVDWMGARQIHKHAYRLGHVGHLVQIPQSLMKEILSFSPEVVTLFNMEKAVALNEAAQQLGIHQDVILRVYRPLDRFYPGHEGGFLLDDVVDAAREIERLEHLQVVGTTAFPCQLFDEESKSVHPTSNFATAIDAAHRLHRELGIKIQQINVPGTTSSDIFEAIAKQGGTHVEPGHGLTGTTPLSTVQETAERPAILYLSEVSHVHNRRAHVFGGGLYIDRVRGKYPLHALVGEKQHAFTQIPDDGIDYYGYLETGEVSVGDSVIFGFRPQVFVTRGQVAVISGVHSGQPKVLGYFDSQGNQLNVGV